MYIWEAMVMVHCVQEYQSDPDKVVVSMFPQEVHLGSICEKENNFQT